MLPNWCGAQSNKANTDFISNFFNLAQVHIHLIAGLMDSLQRRARQLKRPARLKAYISPIFGQPNQMAALFYRRPIKLIAQALQDGLNGALAFVGQCFKCIFTISKFLMLGANAPIRFRFIALLKKICQLVKVFDWTTARLWY